MRQYKNIEKFSVDESCEQDCGSEEFLANIPLRKCKAGCYTTSEEKML